MPLAISQGSPKPAFLPAQQGVLRQTGSRQNHEAFLGLLFIQHPHLAVSLGPDGPQIAATPNPRQLARNGVSGSALSRKGLPRESANKNT